MAVENGDTERQTLNLELVGKILGISRPKVYELARRDQLPVPVIRAGRRMVVSKRALDRVLDKAKDDSPA